MATVSSTLSATTFSVSTTMTSATSSDMSTTLPMSDVTDQSSEMYSANSADTSTSSIFIFNFMSEVLVCNMTLIVEPGEYVLHDYLLRVVLATIVCIILLLGIFGNTLVILAVALSRCLQNVTNVFVVNLAVADLVTSLFLPVHAATLLHQNSCNIPDLLCRFIAAATLTTLGCSIVTLALIAFNRHKVIHQITKSNPNLGAMQKTRNVILMVAFSWIYPILLMCVIVPVGVGSLGYSNQYKVCAQNSDNEYSDFLSLTAGLLVQFPAFIVIIVCYSRILKAVRRHQKELFKQVAPYTASATHSETNVTVSIEDESIISTPSPSHRPESPSPARLDQWSSEPGVVTITRLEKEKRKKLYKQQLRITVNLFTVVCVYTICVMPAAVAVLIPTSDPVIPWFTVLFLCNSCVNPIIYALKHPHFRDVFVCILKCRFYDIPEPSSFLRSSRLFRRKSYSP